MTETKEIPARPVRIFSIWLTLEDWGLVRKAMSDPEIDYSGIDLARVKVRDLGFTSSPTTIELFRRIKKVGGMLCSSEVERRLYLKFPHWKKIRPKSDETLIPMDTIPERSDLLLGFFNRRESDDLLTKVSVPYDVVWELDRWVAFVYPHTIEQKWIKDLNELRGTWANLDTDNSDCAFFGGMYQDLSDCEYAEETGMDRGKHISFSFEEDNVAVFDETSEMGEPKKGTWEEVYELIVEHVNSKLVNS